MKNQDVTQFDKAIALDRINIVNTIMCELFWMWERGYPAYEGLTETAAYHIQQALGNCVSAEEGA